MSILLDDPDLKLRTPGQEFARAFASDGLQTSIELRASISTMFPGFEHRPRLTTRDIMSVAAADRDVVRYVREAPTEEDVRMEIPRATAAPEAKFRYFTAEARMGVVRAQVQIPSEILDDPPALAAFVDYRLLVRLCTAENDFLLTGAGQIEGLLKVPGLRSQEALGSPEETVLAAAAKCERFGGSADGIVMNPIDWWPLVRSGFLRNLAEAGIRINRTRLTAPGTIVVGDFQAGATVIERRRSRLRFETNSDGDSGGLATLVAEQEETLAVRLPGHFVVTTLR
jgi:hypothetical protein